VAEDAELLLEAVEVLDRRAVVVVGEDAALDHVELGNLTSLLAKIHPAVQTAHCSDSHDDACVDKVATENVRQSMHEIHERSPYLAQYVDAGKIRLIGGMYDVSTGKVTFLEP